MSNKRSVRALLATGSRLVGGGVRSFEPVIEELISSAESEIQIAAYSFDHSFNPMLARLEQKAKDGVRVTIILSEIARQDIRVRSALKRMRHATVIDFKANNENSLLHAKVLVVDRKDAVIGSANFTFGGLIMNHEIGVWLQGNEAWKAANLIDQILTINTDSIGFDK